MQLGLKDAGNVVEDGQNHYGTTSDNDGLDTLLGTNADYSLLIGQKKRELIKLIDSVNIDLSSGIDISTTGNLIEGIGLDIEQYENNGSQKEIFLSSNYHNKIIETRREHNSIDKFNLEAINQGIIEKKAAVNEILNKLRNSIDQVTGTDIREAGNILGELGNGIAGLNIFIGINHSD